ncbi:MAG: phosphotransferase family protein [Halioglobus sp.]|nr:phosphotransferase family protein [Halioglobus sp.]
MNEQAQKEHVPEIDVAALERWMDDQGLPGSGEPLTATFISGGASNEIFELRRGDAHMALRKPPAKVPQGRNEIMLREFRVIHALNGTDVPHPEGIAVCDDTDVLGACFYIMGHIDGWTPMGELPPPFRDSPELRRGMAWELVDAIAKLGQVDWRAAGLEGFGKPEGFLDRQVDRWLAHLDKIKFRDIPGLDEAATWLRNHTPRHFTPGIIHGDYQFANVMFHHGDTAKMAAIVDWEMATVGDPLLDLAWILMTWPDPDENRDTGYVDFSGMPSRDELLQRYASQSGLPVDAMDYYIVLARFKMACVLEAGYARYVQGGADNPRMEMFGDVVLDMAAKARQLARTSTLPATQ